MRLLNKAGYSEFSEVVSATAQEGSDALPARWTFAPIGNTLGGSLFTAAQDSTFAVGGAGKDIGGTADSEGFVYLKMKGDATLTVRLSSTEEAFYKVGIQMRSTLGAGAQRVGITLGEKDAAYFALVHVLLQTEILFGRKLPIMARHQCGCVSSVRANSLLLTLAEII